MPDIKPSSLNKERVIKEYEPSKERKEVGDFVFKRIDELKRYRSELGIEEEWREADAELLPSPLIGNAGRKRFESDDETGLRSRLVPIQDETQEWRSDNADPMLLVKIQTALSIIIDSTPDAQFRPMLRKYRDTTSIAKAIWDRSWSLTGAKRVYKVVAFNLFKYGWAAGRTYPLEITQQKKVIQNFSIDDPEGATFTEKELTIFSDIMREPLNPLKTWIDPAAKPYDLFSRNESYFEVDYSEDRFATEFAQYKHADSVSAEFHSADEEPLEGIHEKTKRGQKKVVVGFYENKAKDIYAIVAPSKKVVMFYSPILNDDGMSQVWDMPSMLRDGDSPYGISLWRIIKQDKELYDKMKNMTMDQLVLSIMKMGFITGGASLRGDNVFKIVPGKFEQLPTNAKIDFLDVPGPGKQAFEGLQYLKQIIDDNSGITPTLVGEVTGKTLGEVLHAKESALKRLRTPLENLAWGMEQDIYLTLSWASQLYSTPELRTFTDLEDMRKFEEENQLEGNEIFITGQDEETLEPTEYTVSYLPQLDLKLEKSGGKLYEGKKEQIFQVGKDIKPEQLVWRGIIKIVPRSIVSPSVELEKQKKLEMFNIIAPILGQPPEIYGPSVHQLIMVNDEKPEDWLPDAWIQYLRGDRKKSLFTMSPELQAQMAQNEAKTTGGNINPSGRLTGGFESMQGAAGFRPNVGAPTVLPNEQVGGERPATIGDVTNNSLGR